MLKMFVSAPLLLICSLMMGNHLTGASSDVSFLQHNNKNNDREGHLLHSLHRKLPVGRNKPTAEEMAAVEAEEKAAKHGSLRASAPQRNLEGDGEVSNWVCRQVIDGYLGKTGVERRSCQTCRKDPNDPAQYIITCDFTDYCSFCAHDDPAGADSCYTLTHEYTVRPWNGKFEWIEDIAYSACGIYQDTGRKACLDETYEDWGYLKSRCVSVDDESCQVCEKSKNCKGASNYFYDCGNIEAGFVMDDCDYSINDDIGKESVFVGFNYGMYAKDTDTCFDDNKGYLGNMGGTFFPTASPVAAIASVAATASPVAPTSSPVAPTASPVAATSSPVVPTLSPVTATATTVEKEPKAIFDATPAQAAASGQNKRVIGDIVIRVKVPNWQSGDVTEEIVQTALTGALLRDLSAKFPSLTHVELRGRDKGSRNRLLASKVTFELSGEAFFLKDSTPSAQEVTAAVAASVASFRKIGGWKVRAQIQSKGKGKRKRKACAERGGRWKRGKGCILP